MFHFTSLNVEIIILFIVLPDDSIISAISRLISLDRFSVRLRIKFSYFSNVSFLNKESPRCEFYVLECWVLLYFFFLKSFGLSWQRVLLPISYFHLFGSRFFGSLGMSAEWFILRVNLSPTDSSGPSTNVLLTQRGLSIVAGGDPELCGLWVLFCSCLLAFHIWWLLLS